MSKRERSEDVLRDILESGSGHRARTALVNIARLAELHEVEVLAPFVKGFCNYLAHPTASQKALDRLRRGSDPTYVRLRNLLTEVSGVTDLDEVQPKGRPRELDAVIDGIRVADIEVALDQWSAAVPEGGAASRPCWFVGSSWGEGDQTERFVREGIWENGYTDKLLDEVREVQPGERIAIKSSFTRKKDLPFDANGKFVSVMRIKQVGTVVRNLGDGRKLEVDWHGPGPQDDWYFYTHRGTIWRVVGDKPERQALIAFAFGGQAQDIAGFLADPYWQARYGIGRSEDGVAGGDGTRTLHDAAVAAWPVLVGLALSEPPEYMSYTELGDDIGVIAMNIGKVLHLIQEYCRERGLPPITGLIVNAATGRPSDGFTAGYDGWEDDVRTYPWGDLDAPTPEVLRQYPTSPPTSTGQGVGAGRGAGAADVDRLIAGELADLDKRGAFNAQDEDDARERVARSVALRLGQPEFRKRLINAYEGRCAITGCDVVEVLEAAHIVPYRGEHSNDIRNGLLLRADIHTLLDRQLLALRVERNDFVVDIDASLRDGYYGELHGRVVRTPAHEAFAPDPLALARA